MAEPTPEPPVPLPKVDKPNLGSREVLERVQAFSKKPKAPVEDLFTGKKICHVFKSPFFLVVPHPVKPNEMDLKTGVGNQHCIGSKCSLWDSERLQCLDVTEKQASARVPELLEQIDGFLRLHNREG